jgi:hypothetical protein
VNLPSATTLDAQELAAMVADVSGLIGDVDTRTTIVFVVPGARAYDPGSGTVSYAETSTSVSAFVSDVVLDRKAPEGAQVGDVQALIAYGALATRPEANARFRIATGDRAGTYAVYSATSGPFDTHYLLHAHRVN